MYEDYVRIWIALWTMFKLLLAYTRQALVREELERLFSNKLQMIIDAGKSLST